MDVKISRISSEGEIYVGRRMCCATECEVSGSKLKPWCEDEIDAEAALYDYICDLKEQVELAETARKAFKR